MKDSDSIFRVIDKAVYDYKIIEDGDKILLGASGGKDSTLLAEYFARRKLYKNANFEFLALNIQSDFASPFPEFIKNKFDEWKVPFAQIDVDVLGRLKPGKKMSCYWCSTQRRLELVRYAMANGFNKIALGHHLDDVLETFLMNALHKEELGTMLPKLQYDNYPLQIIRPLYYVLENQIIDYAQKSGVAGFTCTCNYQENSGRKTARKRLEALCDGDEANKRHLLMAIKNVNLKYLP